MIDKSRLRRGNLVGGGVRLGAVEQTTIESAGKFFGFVLALEIDMPTALRSAEGDCVRTFMVEPDAHIAQLLSKIAIWADLDNE
jgi:hypothetical protein